MNTNIKMTRNNAILKNTTKVFWKVIEMNSFAILVTSSIYGIGLNNIRGAN